MNVSLQNIDKVSAKLTVKIEKPDYQEKVEKSLKSIRQKANVPGFRRGMVPMGLIKKQFGKSVLVEELDKILQDEVNKYIQENNVKILGEPLVDEEQKENDLEASEDFEFSFKLALAPEFKASLDNNDTIDYYNIEVTDEMVENQVKMYTQRTGSYQKVEEYAEGDMLKGLLTELDEAGNAKEDGVKVEGAVLMPKYMKEEGEKAKFNGAKVGAVITFNPNKAYEGSEAEIASLLKVDKEKVADMKSDFSFQVEEITRFVNGEINQELFDSVFGKDEVKDEATFRARVKEGIAHQYVGDSDYKFLLDVRKYLTDKIGKLEYADELLKKVMLLNNKDKGEEFVNENYDKSIEELTWHLIKEQLVEANEVKVEKDDLTAAAKEATRAQFAQYGMMNVPDDLLDNYAKEMMKKRESIDALVNRVVDVKLTMALKSKVTLNQKNISVEDFNKMFQ